MCECSNIYINSDLCGCLRCVSHFLSVCAGLKVPSGCELVVGGEPQCWSEGSCLLFDDSFLHTAFHDGEKLK